MYSRDHQINQTTGPQRKKGFYVEHRGLVYLEYVSFMVFCNEARSFIALPQYLC